MKALFWVLFALVMLAFCLSLACTADRAVFEQLYSHPDTVIIAPVDALPLDTALDIPDLLETSPEPDLEPSDDLDVALEPIGRIYQCICVWGEGREDEITHVFEGCVPFGVSPAELAAAECSEIVPPVGCLCRMDDCVLLGGC